MKPEIIATVWHKHNSNETLNIDDFLEESTTAKQKQRLEKLFPDEKKYTYFLFCSAKEFDNLTNKERNQLLTIMENAPWSNAQFAHNRLPDYKGLAEIIMPLSQIINLPNAVENMNGVTNREHLVSSAEREDLFRVMKYALKTLGHKKTAYTEMLKFIKINRPSIFFEAPYTLPGILKRHSAKSVNNLIRKIAELPSNSGSTFRSAYWADVDEALLKTLYDQPENTQLLDSMIDILHKKSPYVKTAGHLEGLTYILPTLLEKDKSAIDLFMTISSEVFNSPGHKMIIKYLNDGLKRAKPNEIKPIIDLAVNVETYEDIKPLEIALEYGSMMYPEMGLDAYHHAMNNLIFSDDNSEILDVVNEYYTIQKKLIPEDLGWIGKQDQEKYQGLVNCAKDCIAKGNPHIIRELKKLKGLSSFELLDDKTSNRAADVFNNMYDSHEMYHNNAHNLFIAAAKIIGDEYGSEEQLKFITDANNDNLHNLLDSCTSMWAHKHNID